MPSLSDVGWVKINKDSADKNSNLSNRLTPWHSHGHWEHWHLGNAKHSCFDKVYHSVNASSCIHHNTPLFPLRNVFGNVGFFSDSLIASSLSLKFKLKSNMVGNLGNLFWAQDTFACLSLDTQLFETWMGNSQRNTQVSLLSGELIINIESQ